MKFCGKCGNQLQDQMKFCGRCGAPCPVKAVPPAGAPAASAAPNTGVPAQNPFANAQPAAPVNPGQAAPAQNNIPKPGTPVPAPAQAAPNQAAPAQSNIPKPGTPVPAPAQAAPNQAAPAQNNIPKPGTPVPAPAQAAPNQAAPAQNNIPKPGAPVPAPAQAAPNQSASAQSNIPKPGIPAAAASSDPEKVRAQAEAFKAQQKQQAQNDGKAGFGAAAMAAAAATTVAPSFDDVGGKAKAKKKVNPMLFVVIGIIVAAIVAAIIIIINVTKYEKIDAQKLFKFDFDGLNEYGTVSGGLNAYDDWEYAADNAAGELAEYGLDLGLDGDAEETVSPYFSLNDDTLLDTYTKAKKDKTKARDMRSALLKRDSSGEYMITCTFDKTEGLKNGDKVKVTVNFDEDYLKDHNIKLENTEFTITVEGLGDGINLDPFAGTNFTASGYNGYGTCSFDAYGNPASSFLMYTVNQANNDNLSNGDVVTVEARYTGSVVTAADGIYYFVVDGTYYLAPNSSGSWTTDFEVTGLSDGTTVDPFEGVTIVPTKYASPYLSVKVDNIPDLGLYTSYTLDKSDDLKAGDTVTVTFTTDPDSYEAFSRSGYIIEGIDDGYGSVSKEFTVPTDVDTYVNSDNASAAFMMVDGAFKADTDSIKSSLKGSKSVGDGVKIDGKITKVSKIEEVGAYVTVSESETFGGDYRNRLVKIYKVTAELEASDDKDDDKDDEKSSKATFYVAVYTDNVIMHSGSAVTESGSDDFKVQHKFFKDEKTFKSEMVDPEGFKTEEIK